MTACQQEFEVIEEPSENESVQAGSELTELLLGIASMDGSADDIVDQSSCTLIILPATVKVGNTYLELTDEADYQEVEKLLEEHPSASVEIQYPVDIWKVNFHRYTVKVEQELFAHQNYCKNGGRFISCLDFQYPIKVSEYNIETQRSSVTVISNDQDLYETVVALSKERIVSFVYPFNLIDADGNILEVTQQEELLSKIKQYKGCK
ncbi:hypothetical protein V6R21_05360 [Limibacter armeniacum]|uniref:hypothetical protein n=1 Tax=Limibacter armeniacum TaxID=466084 RepID=UPI002FE62C16